MNIFKIYQTVCDHTPLRAFLYTFLAVSACQVIALNSGTTDLASKSFFLLWLSVVGPALGFAPYAHMHPDDKDLPNLLTFITIFSTTAFTDYLANQYFFLK